jgi:hypothetical protein
MIKHTLKHTNKISVENRQDELSKKINDFEVRENIKRIEEYFINDLKKQNTDKCIFEIVSFEIEKKKLYPDNIMTSLKIVTDIKNPKNAYLKDKYLIIFSKRGKIDYMFKNGKRQYSLKKIINRFISR